MQYTETEQKMRKTLAERLRSTVQEIRRKPYPISDLIPLLTQAADALALSPAPAVVPDDVQQIIKGVCEAYRGTDYGKVAESICDNLLESITATKARENMQRDGV